MSTVDPLEWGLTALPPPCSLPFLTHLQLSPHSSMDLQHSYPYRGTGISLDLIDEQNLTAEFLASRLPKAPVFGLVDDLFSSYSIKSIQTSHYISSFEHKDDPSLAVSQETPPAKLVVSQASSPLRSSGSLAPSTLTQSSVTITSQQPANSTSVHTAKAKHYSQNSRLSDKQHRLWWSTKNTPPQTSVNDPLKVAIAAEQRLYRESMKQMVLETCAANYNSFHPLVSLCVEALLESNKRNCLRYPAFYTFSGAAEHPFLDTRYPATKSVSRVSRGRLLGNVGVTFELPHIQSPFHSVTLPRSGDFWMPHGKTRTELRDPSATPAALTGSTSSSAQTPSDHPQQASSPKLPTFLKQIQPPVSVDANVRAILHKHHFPFVASASTITCIMNPSVASQWEIPVRIEEVLDERLQLRKVIFLDKPLVHQDMSIKQKNEKFYKMSLKRWLLQNQKTMKMDSQESSPVNHAAEFVDPHHVIPVTTEGPDNLTYSEWMMDDMALLVRGRVDGLTQVARAPNVTHYIPTALVSKMKHVPEHHLEEFSTYEKTKYMVKTHLLGEDARLLVGHVDPVTARLVFVESLTGPQLRMPGPSSIEAIFSTLYDVLNWMKTFGPGTYLLSHASGEQRLIMPRLYEKKTEVTFSGGIAATYDLHERQHQAARSNLDALEYLPPRWDFHRINQIPNTFPPVGKSCCYDFIKNGKCSHPDSCVHLHVSLFEAEQRGLPTPQSNHHNASPSHSSQDSTGSSVSDSPSKRKRKQSRTTEVNKRSKLS